MKSAILVLLLLVSKGSCASRKTRQSSFADAPVDPAEGPCTTSAGTSGVCTAVSRCTTFLDDLSEGRCTLDGVTDGGICCPTAESVQQEAVAFLAPAAGVAFSAPAARPILQDAPIPITVSANEINEASQSGGDALQKKDELENLLIELGIVAQPGTPEANHQFIQFTEESSLSAGRDAFIAQEVASKVFLRSGLAADTAAFSLHSVPLSDSVLRDICPRDPECPATKYRSIDGSCNNLNNRNWGKSQRAFNRMILPPRYKDGIGQPRAASDGSELPSARLISVSVLPDINRELPHASLLLMTWGQFLDHDLIQTPLERLKNGGSITCCHESILRNSSLRHPECMAIAVPPDDKFYSKVPATKNQCMEFVRSLRATPNDCNLSHREQQNQLTAYIDASHIYGSTEATAQNLRQKTGGRLKSEKLRNGWEMPPSLPAISSCKTDQRSQQFCFIAGDSRGIEQPHLTTLQVIWLREHNRIAAELARINPSWDDEILYQESRRIVGAMMQHITYNEFLTVVLGRREMRKSNFLLTPHGFTTDYDSNVDATILNEFATAAYRFGHSNIPGMFFLPNGRMIALRNRFLQAYDIQNIDQYIIGGVTQGSQTTDNSITADVTTMLFRNVSAPNSVGLDLPAINIQRGRDHGIPGYNDVRRFCFLEPASSFKDMERLFSNANIARNFANLYKHVDDVDLWVAGVAEKPLQGAVVGETFACILNEQFRRLKLGDRLWYERANTESSLTEEQISEIRKTSMARVFCDNSDISRIQPLVFFKSARWNSPVSCKSKLIPKISLLPWKNEPPGLSQ